MWISTGGLERKLKKLIDDEYGQDCFINIDEIRITYYDGNPSAKLKGRYGVDTDIRDVWQKDFELEFNYKYFNDVSFIKGMLCQYIYETERID